ncbi:MAG: hypothetical protein LBT46_01360 [Planctomycetaceae bacterium]|jgi:hypothetical protein|nr:hypothetical protein [Planctomycetaceae bacterium]
MAKGVEFNLQTVRKYLFWACIPAGLVFAVIGFYFSVGSVGAAIDSRKTALDGKRSSVKRIQNEQTHPNAGTIKEITTETAGLSNKVYSAWETLEKDQNERNDWNKLGLSKRALEDVTRQRFLGPLNPSTLDNYREAVKTKALIELPKIVQPSIALQPLPVASTGRTGSSSPRAARTAPPPSRTDRPAGSARAGRSRPSDPIGGHKEDDESDELEDDEFAGIISKHGIVVWDPPVLTFTLDDWDKKIEWREDAWKIWLTQEEIWVYDALLNVIRQSNDKVKAASPRSAAVKGIADILIGQAASDKLAVYSAPRSLGDTGTIGRGTTSPTRMGGRGSKDDDEYDEDSRRSSPPTGSRPPSPSAARTAAAGGRGKVDAKTDALNGRYVDKSGTPLPGFDADTPYRRMPIFLSLIVDQKVLPDFLTACANCAMPIDVLWVRINPAASQTFDFSLKDNGVAGAAAGNPSRTGRGSADEDLFALGTSSVSGQAGADGRFSTNNQFGANAVPVEIYGCINIFSPPDKNKLPLAGIKSASVSEQETEKPMPAEPEKKIKSPQMKE